MGSKTSLTGTLTGKICTTIYVIYFFTALTGFTGFARSTDFHHRISWGLLTIHILSSLAILFLANAMGIKLAMLEANRSNPI